MTVLDRRDGDNIWFCDVRKNEGSRNRGSTVKLVAILRNREVAVALLNGTAS